MGFEIIKESTDKTTARNIISMDNGIQPIQEISDTSQTIKEMNDDTVSDNFSAIDMKARLLPIEISSIIAVDSLIALEFLPPEARYITRSKKRLSVSEKGKGREEIVQIAQGMKEQSSGTSMLSRLGGLFGGNRN